MSRLNSEEVFYFASFQDNIRRFYLMTKREKVVIKDGQLQVPDNPTIPFIEGDGTGPDIWAAASRVLDAAVEKAYDGKKKLDWKEVYAGEKAFNKTGEWL